MTNLKNVLIARADSEHTEYAHYANHWDGWDVAEVTATINDKWGDLMAEVGEYVLIKPAGRCPLSNLPETVIYLDSDHHWSGRHLNSDSGMSCSISPGHVRRLTENVVAR
jgi:hypothetical protein